MDVLKNSLLQHIKTQKTLNVNLHWFAVIDGITQMISNVQHNALCDQLKLEWHELNFPSVTESNFQQTFIYLKKLPG